MNPRDNAAGQTAPAQSTARPVPPLWLLVAMTGLGPFTMQILVPSLPALAGALGASTASVQLTLTLYLVGVAVGQLVYGPLSDRFGRRPLLLVGLVLYLAATLAAAVAPSVGWLILARIGQAAGSCAGMVLGRAMIRDTWPRERAASVIGYVTMAMTVAPMVAPVAGSLLQESFGWRSTMLACLVFGVPLLLAMRARLPETLPAPQPLPGLVGLVGAYGQLGALPAFRALAAVTAASAGVFFAFLAGAPFVVVEGLGRSPTEFALSFVMISVAYALGNWLAGRFSAGFGVFRMMLAGALVTVAGAIGMLTALFALPPGLMAFMVPMAVIAVGNGMSQPNAIAAAVSVRPALAGTASGLVGALQMGFGAVMTLLVGLTEDGTGLGTALAMAGCAFGALLALRGAWTAR